MSEERPKKRRGGSAPRGNNPSGRSADGSPQHGKLTEAQRGWIVVQFARFVPAPAIARALALPVGPDREAAGVPGEPAEVWATNLYEFNPLSAASLLGHPDPSTHKWWEIFNAERQRYLDDLRAVPYLNRRHRAELLSEMIEEERAKGVPNKRLIMDLAERLAKEEGGMYTNRREITGKDGGAVALDVTTMTEEERAKKAAALINRALGRKAPGEDAAE